ncbi:hypothetical protein OFN97_04535 [Campylobacter sp. VBCF_05 NA6]|uniref:hypothetical protein n=1 Tax=unclassified Campylobacter TaxID=2593542 RepID=UPI0022E99A59|nr:MULTISPECIES: hypothetical protein [unclassified Campylobacter]MDA3057946.1 hypothetical protein [Campylobacter sp. VBCF_04 NA7]MDA3059277.1 hypothetical protein [Campylobacter sp. VBCF_05 NA6]
MKKFKIFLMGISVFILAGCADKNEQVYNHNVYSAPTPSYQTNSNFSIYDNEFRWINNRKYEVPKDTMIDFLSDYPGFFRELGMSCKTGELDWVETNLGNALFGLADFAQKNPSRRYEALITAQNLITQNYNKLGCAKALDDEYAQPAYTQTNQSNAFAQQNLQNQMNILANQCKGGNANSCINLGNYALNSNMPQQAKEFYGMACDNRSQEGCDYYRILQEKGY